MRRYLWQSFTNRSYSIMALMPSLTTIVAWWLYRLFENLNFSLFSFGWDFPYLNWTLLSTIVFISFAESSLLWWSTRWKTNWVRIWILLHWWYSVVGTLRILRTSLSTVRPRQLIRIHDLLRYILKTLLSLFFSAFSQVLMMRLLTLLARRFHIIHFVDHLYSSTWIWRIVTHKYVLWSNFSNAIAGRNCYFVLINVILYFWLFLSKIHHSTRSYHRLLLLIGVSFVALI